MAEVLALANLDFENELAASSRPLPPEHLARWRYILRLLPQAREAECLDPAGWGKVATARSLVLWGVTPRTAGLARQLGLNDSFPPPAVVRAVNDKRFSHQLEKGWNWALPYSQVVESVAALEAAVGQCPHDWVLKHPLGFSARERAVGKAGRLSDSAGGWARRKFRSGWTLLFEPWVEQRHDFSCHFEIEPGGKVHFVGHCQLVSDPGGVYRGNRVVPGPAPAATDEVAAECARQGYWGPLGVDGFTGWLGGQEVLRPLVEINARMSFGRLTLALGHWLPPGWCYAWLHPKVPRFGLPAIEARPGRYALPRTVDPEGNSGTVVVMAPTPEELSHWEAPGSIAT